MKRQLLTGVMIMCLLAGCASGASTTEGTATTESEESSQASTGSEEAEQASTEAEESSSMTISKEGVIFSDETVAGWHIVVEQIMTGKSMKNVSVDLGYTGVETSEYVKDASEGCVLYAVKLNIEKQGGTEPIEWEKMILSDSEGNEYHRIDDAFLTDLGVKHMSGSDLNFGSNEGWIVYEIPEQAEGLTLSYAFADETFSCSLEIKDDSSDSEQSDESEENTEGNVLTQTDVFAKQNSVDQALGEEVEKAGDITDPTVIVDPYGVSPLTAVVIFRTDNETGGTITVKGKAEENDITGTFASSTEHIVPVYGLYNGEATEVVLTLDDGQTNTLEITTTKQDLDFGEITTEMIDAESYDYSKLTFVYPFGGTIYAVDSAGDIRWCYSGGGSMGVHPLKNGHLMVPSAFVLKSSYYKEGLQEIDLCGKIYKQYAIPGGQHHDFQELPNGNLLVAGDAPDLSSIEDHVVEIDRETGEVVWSLDMKDLLPVGTGQSASMDTDGSEEIDWFHNNSLWYDEATDRILLSARHVDAIVAVNKSDKTLAWILGDPTGWENVDPDLFFTPEGDDFEWQYAQHQVTMLDNGDIMLFDNGTAKVKRVDGDNRVTGDDVYSRAVVYRINTDNMTVSQVFEYGKERGSDWYADWVSGVESQDGTADNLWITAGSHLHNEEEGRNDYYPKDMMTPGLVKSAIVDQVVDGKLAFEMVISGDTFLSLAFRTSRIAMYGDNCAQDIEITPEYLGDLGVTPPAKTETSAEPDETLATEGWNFTMDRVKLSVSGNYSSEHAVDEIPEDYLVLSNGEESRYYTVTQYKTESEQGTAVSVNGWLSRSGLEGTWKILMMLDGVLYDTGYTVNPYMESAEELANEPAEMQSKEPVGYYGRVIDASLDMDDLQLISENDASAGELNTDITVNETLVASSLSVDQMVEEELASDQYTFENPLVISNPYQNSSLTGLILFSTEKECAVRVTVKGKTEAADISGELKAAKRHRVPVIGLYPGTENTVVLEELGDDGSVVATNEIIMQTDELPEAMEGRVKAVKSSGDSAFGLVIVSGQGSMYPYAYDCNGDVRWYSDRKVGNYGLYILSNGRMIIQDTAGYTPNLEKPQSVNLYEMDLLGRYYRMYYLANGTHHEVIEKEPGGNLLCLTSSLENHYEDEIVEIDRETGEIVNELELIDIFGDTYTDLIDWAHINTLSWQKDNDTILISCRNLHSVMKIGWSDHELKWILSNPEFWKGTPFEEYVLDPVGDFHWYYHQHTSYQLSADLDGNPNTVEISVFDNHIQSYRKVSFFDGLENSYVMVFSVDEKAGTVQCLKDLEVIRSTIMSNTIYDEESGHIFGMCGFVPNDLLEGCRGMTYEFDYETGEILNQYSFTYTFYRASPVELNYEDLSEKMDVEEDYIKGTLKKSVKTEETVEVPEKTLTDEEVSVSITGNVLYAEALDHTVSQVIFKGKSNTYVYDAASIRQFSTKYEDVSVATAIPLQNLEADTYEIICVYKNEAGRVEGSFTIK